MKHTKEYKQKIYDLLRANTVAETAVMLDAPAYLIKGVLERGIKAGEINRSEFKRSKDSWTPEQIEYLKENYPTCCAEDIAEILGKKYSAVVAKASKLKVRKQPEFWVWFNRIYGKAGHFPKGHKSWNKGTKGVCKANSASFKKGNKPGNTYKGTGVTKIRTRFRGNDRGIERYIWYKVADSNWVMLHRLIWEQANGPIPKNKVLRFKDGNTLNVVLENLELISKAEHLWRNRQSDIAVLKAISTDYNERKKLSNQSDLIEALRLKRKLSKQVYRYGQTKTS